MRNKQFIGVLLLLKSKVPFILFFLVNIYDEAIAFPEELKSLRSKNKKLKDGNNASVMTTMPVKKKN